MKKLLHLVPTQKAASLWRLQPSSNGLFIIRGHHHGASPSPGSWETSSPIYLLMIQPETIWVSRQSPVPQGQAKVKRCSKLFGPRAKAGGTDHANVQFQEVLSSEQWVE